MTLPTKSLSFYDSLLHVIDACERTAVETGDSLLRGRRIVQRGRVQLMTGSFVESANTIERGISIAGAVRDTSTWMPALTFKGYALAGLGSYGGADRPNPGARDGLRNSGGFLRLVRRVADWICTPGGLPLD